MIVAGLGFRRHVAIAALTDALDAAIRACEAGMAKPAALATAADKASEPALLDLAVRLGVPIIAVAPAEMQRVSHLAATHSKRVAELRGVPSLAETCALAAAGGGARLICPRVANRQATCALAEGEGP